MDNWLIELEGEAVDPETIDAQLDALMEQLVRTAESPGIGLSGRLVEIYFVVAAVNALEATAKAHALMLAALTASGGDLATWTGTRSRKAEDLVQA